MCRLDVNIVINIIICLYVNAIFDDDVIEFIFRLGWEVKYSAEDTLEDRQKVIKKWSPRCINNIFGQLLLVHLVWSGLV